MYIEAAAIQNHALPLENAAVSKVFSNFWSLMGALGAPYECLRVSWDRGDGLVGMGGCG